jgi:hypothetical protein
VKYYNVSKEASGNMMETEVLLEGNGVFYTDRERRNPGVRQLTFGEVMARRDELGIFEETLIGRTAAGDVISANAIVREGARPEDLVGIFEGYYFPPGSGGKRRKTSRNKRKTRRRLTRKRR